MEHVITSNKYLPLSPNEHNIQDGNQNLDIIEGEQAEDLGNLNGRASILEKYKSSSSPPKLDFKHHSFGEIQEFSLSQEEDIQPAFTPFNINRNSRAERMEKYLDSLSSPRTPIEKRESENFALERSPSEKLRDFQKSRAQERFALKQENENFFESSDKGTIKIEL